MRFSDRMKLALHNFAQSRSRTILTVIIVFIVSALISAIVLMGLNYTLNTNKYIKEKFEKESSVYRFTAFPNFEIGSSIEITPDEYSKLSGIISKHSNAIDNVYTRPSGFGYGSINNCYFYDYNFGFVTDGALTEGRVWTKADAGTNAVWLSEAAIAALSDSLEEPLKPGEQVTVTNGQNAETIFVIVGIIKNIQSTDYYEESPDFIIDFTYAYENLYQYTNTGEIYMKFSAPQKKYRLNQIMNGIKAFVDEVNISFPKAVDPTYGNEIPRISNDILDEYEAVRLFNLVVAGLAVILGLIVLFLSIGSIANSVIINMDKNRRFTGLLKAMGLRHSSVKSIIYIEASVSIILGIMLSTIVLLSINRYLKQLMSALMGYIFERNINVIFSMPVYLPFAVAAVFILTALLFARGSLRKIEKQDVISIISEVD